MSARRDTGRPQRRRQEESGTLTRSGGWRPALGAGFVLVVLGAGAALAFGDFIGRPDGTATTSVRMSMAGFEPEFIHAAAGEELELELWTTDSALHLEGGVHTLISDSLGIYEELPAESRRTVTLRMPDEPGTYDIYCDTCCGGKASPSMHGRIHVG